MAQWLDHSIWRFADVVACRAVSNPAWCRIMRERSCFSPLNLGTLSSRCCVLGQGTSPSNASLDSGGRTEMEMCTISSISRNGCRTVCSPWSWDDTRMNRSSDHAGVNVNLADMSSNLISDYKRLPLSFFLTNLRLTKMNTSQICHVMVSQQAAWYRSILIAFILTPWHGPAGMISTYCTPILPRKQILTQVSKESALSLVWFVWRAYRVHNRRPTGPQSPSKTAPLHEAPPETFTAV